MRLPREISGAEFTRALKEFGYKITRQTGSHIRLTTTSQGEHHITVPAHKVLKIGIVSAVLGDVALHFQMDKNKLIEKLFKS